MNLISVIVFIAVAFALSFMVEASTEYFFGTPMDKFPKVQEWKWVLMYVSAGLAVGLALYWKIDLIAAIATFVAYLVNAPDFVWEVSPVGMVVSGLAIGRGSNFLHDWLAKSLKKPDVTDLPPM